MLYVMASMLDLDTHAFCIGRDRKIREFVPVH